MNEPVSQLEPNGCALERAGSDPPLSSVADQSLPSRSKRPGGKLVELGIGLLLLAVLRTIPIAWAISSIMPFTWWPSRVLDLLISDLGLSFLVLACWPLFLSVCIITVRTPRLADAAALTSFLLSADRICSLGITASIAGRMGLLASSASEPGQPEFGIVLKEVAEIVLGFALTLGYWKVARSASCQARRSGESASNCRAIRGRLAILGSMVLGVFVGYSQLWTVYVEILSRSQNARKLFLTVEKIATGPPRRETPESRRGREAGAHYSDAAAELATGRFREARNAYAKGLSAYSILAREYPKNRGFRDQLALGSNNLAWLLATCADPRFWRPAEAVSLAKRAVELVPRDGNYWNTLGAARFRAEDYTSAVEALDHGMQLRQGGDAFDWFFLAMIEAKLGHLVAAQDWYDKAVADLESRPADTELWRFRIEAAELLGLPTPEPPKRAERSRPAFLFRKRLGELPADFSDKSASPARRARP